MKRILTILFLAFSLSAVGQNFFWSHTSEDICLGYLYNHFALTDAKEFTSSASWVIPTESIYNTISTSVGGYSDFLDLVYNDLGWSTIGSFRQSSDGSFQTGNDDTWTNTAQFGGFKTLRLEGSIAYQAQASEKGYPIALVKSTTDSNGSVSTYTGNDGRQYKAIAYGGYYLTSEISETQYRDGSYISGFDGGVYTPISDASWVLLATGALCIFNDNIIYICK